MDHLAWLAEIGFINTDVVWKDYNFAVYGGTKPEESKVSERIACTGSEVRIYAIPVQRALNDA